MGGFSIWHILIFAILLLLLFGGNRFSSMMGDVAKGFKSFKQGLGDEDVGEPSAQQNRRLPPPPTHRDQLGVWDSAEEGTGSRQADRQSLS